MEENVRPARLTHMSINLIVVVILMLASCNAVEPTSQPALFRPGPVLKLASKPSNLAVADLNKDGRLDLIVTSEEARAVTVMLDFRVEDARTITLAEAPGEIAIGDVNGDNHLDLALDSHDSYHVTMLLGDGKAGFTLAPNSPIVMKQGQHAHTHGLGLGDLNGDGKLDLATVNNEDNDVSVAFGDGRGTFTIAPRSPFAVGPSPYPLTLGDVNRDGRLDIVATASATGPARAQQLAASRALTLLLADGQGGFRASQIPLRTGQPWFVAIGDLNGDGKADLAATHHDQGVLTVLLGDGAGVFRETSGSPFDMGHNVWRVDLADVNRDGRADVVAAADDSVRVMLGDGTGNFRPAPTPRYQINRGTWRLVVGDVNADGKPDVVTSNTESSTVSVLLGT